MMGSWISAPRMSRVIGDGRRNGESTNNSW
jgi:hypothetical protein